MKNIIWLYNISFFNKIKTKYEIIGVEKKLVFYSVLYTSETIVKIFACKI